MNAPADAHSFSVTRENFQTEVIDASRELPILLVFFAPQMPDSVEQARVLRQLATAYAGAFRLGLVDMSVDPGLAQPMRVQGLPSVRAVRDGNLAGALDGPQPDSELKKLIDSLTMSSSELLREQLDDMIAREDFASALRVVQQALAEEPNNKEFLVELADLLALTGRVSDAREALAKVPEETVGRGRVVTRLELLARAESLASLGALRAAREQAPEDAEATYHLAVKLASINRSEEALELAFSLLMNDRAYGEDAGRKLMLEIFDLLGKGSPLAKGYRRKMFNFLH